MMNTIRDTTALIGFLEDGQLHQDFGAEARNVLAKLYELSADQPKAKIKGSLTLKISFQVEGGVARIEAAVESTTPKPPRPHSLAWLLPDGTLSTQHPKQIDMFQKDGSGRLRAAE